MKRIYHKQVFGVVEEMIKDHFASKCDEFDEDCSNCEIWKKWEEFKELFNGTF